MMDTNLEKLAERVERATARDIELDVSIAQMVNDALPAGSARWTWRADHISLPAYTASIDAALTLVPEGWRWWHMTHPRSDEPMEMGLVRDGNLAIVGRSLLPARALCAAALRARAQDGETRG